MFNKKLDTESSELEKHALDRYSNASYPVLIPGQSCFSDKPTNTNNNNNNLYENRAKSKAFIKNDS